MEETGFLINKSCLLTKKNKPIPKLKMEFIKCVVLPIYVTPLYLEQSGFSLGMVFLPKSNNWYVCVAVTEPPKPIPNPNPPPKNYKPPSCP
jgi:hypothetical protein